jgi:hypothetical protein
MLFGGRLGERWGAEWGMGHVQIITELALAPLEKAPLIGGGGTSLECGDQSPLWSAAA